MLYDRRVAARVQGTAFFALGTQPKPPDYSMFADRFVSVYTTMDEVGFNSQNPPQQPFTAMYSPKSSRLDDPLAEEQFRRTDHTLLFRYITGIIRVLQGYSQEFPDLCDDPWTEYVRQTGPSVPSNLASLFPFRQINRGGFPVLPGQPMALLWYQSPNLRIEPEADTVNRTAYYGLALGYPLPLVIPVAPVPPGFRVQAVQAGFYNEDYKDIGDVFDLITGNDFSDSTVSQVPVGDPDYPVYGWMKIVPFNTQLFSWAASGLSSPRFGPRRTVE